MAGEMLAQAAHASLQHVPYKGCGPAITAVAATQLPVAVVTASSAAPLIAAGRVRAIAVTAPARVASLPDVPTMAEQGLAGFAVEQWHGCWRRLPRQSL
jgi:tripartite-type tricarboxylate transporter receptor subunit TctC